MHYSEQETSAPAKNGRGPSELHVQPVLTTIKGTRAILGLGNTSVWGLIKTGELHTVKFGRRTMVVVESIHETIARRVAEKAE